MKNDNLKEKICLCIDTSTKVSSVAIGKSFDGSQVDILYNVFINDGLTHSENLIPMIDQCLTACKLSTSDIDIFGCINGPGSFTGLRIGISTANSLCQSTDGGLIGVNSLETIAYAFGHFKGLIIPMIDARRDNVYTAMFESDNQIKRISEDDVKSIDNILENIKEYKGNILFAGCGANKGADRARIMFADRVYFADGINNNVNSSIAMQIIFREYFSDNYEICKVLLPDYVKEISAKTQAERSVKN